MNVLNLLLPNLLTVARLVLGLALPWVPVEWRLPAVAFAGLSDLLDGAFSRWLGATSYLGRVLDPIADKVFVLGLLCVLLVERSLSIGDALLVGLRDLSVMFGAGMGVALRRWDLFRRLAPTLLGKLATVAQFLFLFVLMLPAQPGRTTAFLLAVSLSGLAAIDYLRRFRQLIHQAPVTSDQ
ncbi:MAG: CDP-alcohol phosphatidyltransferase family protein [Gemmataceae bacterium]